MRKLKLQMQISLDGFVAGAGGEMDWMEWKWDDELLSYVNDITEPVDTIIMGSNMAEGFMTAWKSRLENPEGEADDAVAARMIETPKVVFSHTLESSDWENTKLAKGNLAEEIADLKNASGGDIIAYGGAKFASSLIRENLVDEYYFFINPVILGKGMAIFSQVETGLRLKLIESGSFKCGIVGLRYEPKR